LDGFYLLSQEVTMSFARRLVFLGTLFFSLVFVVAHAGVVWADSIGPAREQEFSDARGALEAALNAQAEVFAPSHLNQARDLLQTADKARRSQDAERFVRASRMARAHAELAKALAEFKADEDQLAATNEALQKAKAEIEGLKKSQ